MPENLDDNELVSTSSDETNQDATLDAGTLGADEVNGAPSGAQDVTEERTTLDVVEDVVKERTEEGSSPEAKKEGEVADPKATQEETDAEIDNDPRLGPKARKRIKQLLGERDTVKRDLEAYKPDAEAWRNIDKFLGDHGVSHKDAAESLQILALSKIDPAKAWQMARPWVQQLLVDAGEVLPAPLKARVESGELTVEAANELARAEARAAGAVKARESDQQRREREAQQTQAGEMRNTVESWEADREAKDPNWAAKKPLVMKELVWIQSQEGQAKTPAEAKAQLDKAYAAASAAAAPVVRRQTTTAPRVGEATRRPAAGSASQSKQRPEEASTLSIIDRVLSQRGAAA